MEVLSSEIKILHVPQEETEVQYTKKGTVRKRKPKIKKMYFTLLFKSNKLPVIRSHSPVSPKKQKSYSGYI